MSAEADAVDRVEEVGEDGVELELEPATAEPTLQKQHTYVADPKSPSGGRFPRVRHGRRCDFRESAEVQR